MGKKNRKNRQNKQNENFQAKRDAVLKKEKKKGSRDTVIGIGIAVAILAAVVFFTFSGGSGFAVVEAEAGMVRIPVADVSDGHSHYYTYKGSNGKKINFFVLKSSDGILRAAFDACDVCFREKKGYRQEGDYMVCNNCGQKFASVNVNVLKGGCNPAPLDRYVEGDTLVVKSSDIEAGGYYF